MRNMAMLLPLLAAVLLPVAAQAHSFGSFYEEMVGQYLVDIGYDPPEPAAGGRLLFDFGLYADAERTIPEEFDSAWVRLEHNGELLLAGPIARMPLGPTTLVVRAPEAAGEMVVHARFERDSGALAEVSFPIIVTEPPREGMDRRVWMLGGIGALLLGFYMYLYRRRSAAA